MSEALAASLHPNRRRPAISVGDPADLIVLDDDPFTASPEALRRMAVAATMLAGHWTHRTEL